MVGCPHCERLIKCSNCNSVKVKYSEWSPDGETEYFCSKRCYKEYSKEHIYRAMSIKKISVNEYNELIK